MPPGDGQSFPHFKHENGIIMIFPYVCKELTAKHFAFGKAFYFLHFLNTIIIELIEYTF